MHNHRSRSGFSFIELLLYITLFITASVLIVGVLESIVRIQGHENAVSTVTSETNFVMQAIQRVVRETSLIQEASSSLLLRAKNLTKDPTRIYLSSNTIYLQEGNAAPVALTTAQVNASGLTFTKFSNPPSKDTVQIDLTIAYNTSNPRSVFSKTLRSAISKVSAVTFDSDLIPSTSNLKVGTGAQKWQDANYSGAVAIDGNLTVDTRTLFVDATNNFVGVGTSSPQSALTVGGSGYLQIGTVNGVPTATDCDVAAELGRIIFDYSNNRLYTCDGTGGWRFATTT
jgi:hypothetical protein